MLLAQYQKNCGIQLIELLICIALIAILSLIGNQGSTTLFNHARADAEFNRLQQFLKKSRQYALNNRQSVHVCSLVVSESRCRAFWGSQLSAFIDLNHNHQYDPALEKIILSMRFKSPHSVISKRSISYLDINSAGMNNKLGSLYYCYVSTSFYYAMKISASMQGRFKAYATQNNNCL